MINLKGAEYLERVLYIESIMSHEYEWDGVVNGEKIKSPVPMISKEEVKKACIMKN